MNPWLLSHVLLAALCLTAAADEPAAAADEPAAAAAADECKELLKPLSLADPSVMLGTGTLLMGFTNNQAFNSMMNMTQGSWINMVSEGHYVVMKEELKLNGTCLSLSVNISVEGDNAFMYMSNMSSSYHLLPSCAGCFVISGNTTAKNMKETFRLLHINTEVEDEINAAAIYFYSKEASVKDEDRERFMKQASCLGFTGDPNFQYNPDTEVCKEGEGVQVHL